MQDTTSPVYIRRNPRARTEKKYHTEICHYLKGKEVIKRDKETLHEFTLCAQCAGGQDKTGENRRTLTCPKCGKETKSLPEHLRVCE